jgi:type II secretory pathway pseudopilin PulG
MKISLKSNSGSTLVEVVIAVAVFTIVASSITAILVSSQKLSFNNYDSRKNYEGAVGTMDSALDGSSDSIEVNTEEATISVSFPSGGGGSTNIDVQKILDDDYHIGVVKKK